MSMQNDPFLVVNFTNNTGIWIGAPDSLNLFAREGTVAPGTSGAYFGEIASSPIQINNADHIVFKGNLVQGPAGVDSSNDTGLWTGSISNIVLLAREGSQAPDVPAGATFTANFDVPAINGSGQVAFRADLNIGGGGVTSTNNNGLWFGFPTNLSLAAREGGIAAGTGSATFTTFESPVVNSLGQIAFKAALRNAGSITTTNDAGIWAGAPGSLVLVAAEGATAPGIAGGGVFSSFFDVRLNNAGNVAFHANLVIGSAGVSSTNEYGIWAGSISGPTLIVRKGHTAAGTSNATFLAFTYLEYNKSQIVFSAQLNPSGDATTANDTGIWATDPCGDIRLVLREGDMLEVRPGDFRTVTGFSFPLVPAPGKAFSNSGNLAVRATFSDGSSGILKLDASGIPKLTIEQLGPNVRISWPVGIECADLRYTDNLNAPIAWSPVGVTITTSNGTNSALLPINSTTRFFQLRPDL